jgi:hypothetical protein
MRVVPGGRCLECVHPYDAELPLKYRAQQWGVGLEEIRRWTAENVVVTREMVDQLARIQYRDSADYQALVGVHARLKTRRVRQSALEILQWET